MKTRFPFSASLVDTACPKETVWRAMQDLASRDFQRAGQRWLAPDCQWVVSHPINELRGPSAVADQYCSVLLRALPDLERRPDLFFGGLWDGHIDGGKGSWVTCTGHFLGTFKQSLFGIPATGDPVWLRFGEFFRVEDGKIVEARILLDLVDLARQAGQAILPKGRGLEVLVPGPINHDGLNLAPSLDSGRGSCLDIVEAMIAGLGRYDQNSLKSMGMTDFWSPDMMWYGPGGIGTSRAISGFEQHHQKPFLHALPDRKGGHHRARFGEGAFAASTGWPSVRATHLGDYLGIPASGKAVELRVMDWWRAENGRLAENWVLLDLPHFFLQMDVDILARARK